MTDGHLNHAMTASTCTGSCRSPRPPRRLARSSFTYYRLVGELTGSPALAVFNELMDRVVLKPPLALMLDPTGAEHRRSIIAASTKLLKLARVRDAAGARELWAEFSDRLAETIHATFEPGSRLGLD